MAKVQIVMAMTIDGYFPEEGSLLRWLRNDRNGFIFWQDRCSLSIGSDYPMIDFICLKDTSPSGSVFQTIVSDRTDIETVRKLCAFHLPDEMVVYVLPVVSGKGTRIADFLAAESGNSFLQGVSATGYVAWFIAGYRNSLSQMRQSCDRSLMEYYGIL